MSVRVLQENKPQCASVYQIFVTLANIPLAKVSHMVKTEVSVGGDYTGTWISVVVIYHTARMTKLQKNDTPNVGKDVE